MPKSSGRPRSRSRIDGMAKKSYQHKCRIGGLSNAIEENGMEVQKRLRIACTTDCDDAFTFDALELGHVALPGYELEFVRQPISVLNRAALHGQFDVCAISSVLYPRIARRYAILSVGTTVGRGCGPVLVARRETSLDDLAGRPVGVSGIPSTGWFLLRYLCPDAVPIEMSLDRIGEAVASGELEAGVMVHDASLQGPRLGLHVVVDLGGEWCQRTGLPLPLGLNVIRRDLGFSVMRRVCEAMRRSLCYGLEHAEDTLERVRRFGRGTDVAYPEQSVATIAQEDSLWMADDVRMGLRVLLAQVSDLGLVQTIPPLDVVEALEPATSLRAA